MEGLTIGSAPAPNGGAVVLPGAPGAQVRAVGAEIPAAALLASDRGLTPAGDAAPSGRGQIGGDGPQMGVRDRGPTPRQLPQHYVGGGGGGGGASGGGASGVGGGGSRPMPEENASNLFGIDAPIFA